jgi:hypothetical protein
LVGLLRQSQVAPPVVFAIRSEDRLRQEAEDAGVEAGLGKVDVRGMAMGQV